MKKSLILGAAAMMAVAAAPQAEAAEVNLSGYYMMRFMDTDATLTDAGNLDDTQAWFQRMQINLKAKVSDKTSAHLEFRPLADSLIEGVDATPGSSSGTTNSGTANTDTAWDIKRAWMETEMYGVGVKVGNLPLNINDKLLFKDSGGSYGALVLSKSFGDVTLVGLNVRIDEEAATGTTTSDDDDTDLYGLSLLGKAGKLDYQLTWAHLNTGKNATNFTADSDNDWIALTAGGSMGSVKLTGTLIWETGMDTPAGGSSQVNDSGVLAALRLKGKTGFGGWNGYVFYAGEDFTHPQGEGNSHVWSLAWDQGGVNGRDLMRTWAAGSGNSNQIQNMWGIGAGLSIKAGAWTIAPNIDYGSVVDETPTGFVTASISDHAWGGSLVATTKLDEGTSFSLIAIGVNPSESNGGTSTTVASMHALQAEFKVKF